MSGLIQGTPRLECFRKKPVPVKAGMGTGFPKRSTPKQRARVFPRFNQKRKVSSSKAAAIAQSKRDLRCLLRRLGHTSNNGQDQDYIHSTRRHQPVR